MFFANGEDRAKLTILYILRGCQLPLSREALETAAAENAADDEQQDDELQSDVQQDGSQDYEADKDIIQCLEEIPELDVNTGLTYCMDKDFYKDMLKEYIQSEKTASIEQYFESKDWDNYRVLVHALKSTSLTIGAVSLSEQAKALDMAAKDGKEDYILSHHREVMEDYKGLLNTLHEVLE